MAQHAWVYPVEPALRLIVDCSRGRRNTRQSGTRFRSRATIFARPEPTAAQELAFTLANGFTYVERGIARGLHVDVFAPQLSFFWDVHNDFFEEIAKLRAARRIWARHLRERYGAQDPRSWMMRFHSQTAGVTLTAQQPMNNIARVAYQALAAVLGGTQSLHTNSMDETLALPTEEAVQVALRTQQILAYETGVAERRRSARRLLLRRIADRHSSRGRGVVRRVERGAEWSRAPERLVSAPDLRVGGSTAMGAGAAAAPDRRRERVRRTKRTARRSRCSASGEEAQSSSDSDWLSSGRRGTQCACRAHCKSCGRCRPPGGTCFRPFSMQRAPIARSMRFGRRWKESSEPIASLSSSEIPVEARVVGDLLTPTTDRTRATARRTGCRSGGWPDPRGVAAADWGRGSWMSPVARGARGADGGGRIRGRRPRLFTASARARASHLSGAAGRGLRYRRGDMRALPPHGPRGSTRSLISRRRLDLRPPGDERACSRSSRGRLPGGMIVSTEPIATA